MKLKRFLSIIMALSMTTAVFTWLYMQVKKKKSLLSGISIMALRQNLSRKWLMNIISHRIKWKLNIQVLIRQIIPQHL